jgi:hypothetical protein
VENLASTLPPVGVAVGAAKTVKAVKAMTEMAASVGTAACRRFF